MSRPRHDTRTLGDDDRTLDLASGLKVFPLRGQTRSGTSPCRVLRWRPTQLERGKKSMNVELISSSALSRPLGIDDHSPSFLRKGLWALAAKGRATLEYLRKKDGYDWSQSLWSVQGQGLILDARWIQVAFSMNALSLLLMMLLLLLFDLRRCWCDKQLALPKLDVDVYPTIDHLFCQRTLEPTFLLLLWWWAMGLCWWWCRFKVSGDRLTKGSTKASGFDFEFPEERTLTYNNVADDHGCVR
ncbi:hypothetical protein B0O80DRAFT_448395 [Mortierella sp. GBAus27b]|nr:hypothetical protein B0O80DRAFT_448395 [Mortierella sp. GBAus27b]